MKAILSKTPATRLKRANKLKKKKINFFFWTGKFANGKVAYCLTYDNDLYLARLKKEKEDKKKK